ncbi:MAG: ribosomal protein L7/L12 [Planctomycetes bacterium]|nr:ribosomal protein L7/L12 [Planctomycetota bacterium]
MKNHPWSPDIVDLGNRIAALTVAGAVELGTYLEEVHGVRALSLPAIVPDVQPGRVIDQKAPEPTEFDVVLDGFEAARRVAVIRAVREATGLGLREVRDAVDACPKVVKERLPRPEAAKLLALLESAGARASIRPCAA